MASWFSTLDNFNLSDPATIAESVRRPDSGIFDPAQLPLWRRANSYYCPRGREAGHAFALVNRVFYDQLKVSKSGFHNLTLRDQFGSISFP